MANYIRMFAFCGSTCARKTYSCGYVAVWYVTMWPFYCMICDHVTTLLLGYEAMHMTLWLCETVHVYTCYLCR